VALERLDAADRQHRLAPDVDHVGAEREREQRAVGQPEPACADEHDVLGQAPPRGTRVGAREADLERQRDVVGEGQRRGAGAALGTVDRDVVRPGAGLAHAPRERLPEAQLADRRLDADGRPVRSAIASISSMSSSTFVNAVWRGGRDAVLALGTPRMRAISGVTFAPGSMPPRPGLAPCESLNSIGPDRALGDPLAQAVQRERPVVGAAAEVARADLEDQLAAVQVRRGETALADVVQARRRGGAAVERLDAGGDSEP
jgi:hypothetical protein